MKRLKDVESACTMTCKASKMLTETGKNQTVSSDQQKRFLSYLWGNWQPSFEARILSVWREQTCRFSNCEEYSIQMYSVLTTKLQRLHAEKSLQARHICESLGIATCSELCRHYLQVCYWTRCLWYITCKRWTCGCDEPQFIVVLQANLRQLWPWMFLSWQCHCFMNQIKGGNAPKMFQCVVAHWNVTKTNGHRKVTQASSEH